MTSCSLYFCVACLVVTFVGKKLKGWAVVCVLSNSESLVLVHSTCIGNMLGEGVMSA